jgi:SOS-response transcriptional repressor LexA
MKEITEKQLRILNAIVKYIDEKGYPPSYRDLMKLVNLSSPSTIKNYFDQLRKKGYISWEEGQPRTIRILKQKENCLK